MVICLHDHRPYRNYDVTNADLRMLFWFSRKQKYQNGAEWPFTTILKFVCNIYKAVCLQNIINVGIFMVAMCSTSWLQDEF